jgi:hypothetical protein
VNRSASPLRGRPQPNLRKNWDEAKMHPEHLVAHLPVQQIEPRTPQHEIRNGYDLGIGF